MKRTIINLSKDAKYTPVTESRIEMITPDYVGIAKVINALSKLYDSANDKTVVDDIASNLFRPSEIINNPEF